MGLQPDNTTLRQEGNCRAGVGLHSECAAPHLQPCVEDWWWLLQQLLLVWTTTCFRKGQAYIAKDTTLADESTEVGCILLTSFLHFILSVCFSLDFSSELPKYNHSWTFTTFKNFQSWSERCVSNFTAWTTRNYRIFILASALIPFLTVRCVLWYLSDFVILIGYYFKGDHL